MYSAGHYSDDTWALVVRGQGLERQHIPHAVVALVQPHPAGCAYRTRNTAKLADRTAAARTRHMTSSSSPAGTGHARDEQLPLMHG